MESVKPLPARGHGFWSFVGRQLRHPAGLAGRAMGAVMTAANRQPVECAIEVLNPMPGDRVLELGFGSGYGLERLASIPRIGKICGIDQSQVMFEAAARRNHAAIARGDMQLVRGPIADLPWEDGIFDHALMVNVVYFLGNDGRDIRELRRVLKPGGTAVAYATAKSSMRSWPFCEPETHRLFDAHELKSLFQAGGFPAELIVVDTVRLPLGISGYVLLAHKPI
jgi:ubiquinone/menaquinone biosynthesis C-methylase UbiE